MSGTHNNICQSIKRLIPTKIRTILIRIYQEVKREITRINDYLFYFKPFSKRVTFTVLDDKETIEQVLKKHVSIARFGDGEYSIMNNRGNGFQDPDPKLKDRLIEVLSSKKSTCLVCIPRPLIYQKGLNRKAKSFWNAYIKKNGEFILRITPSHKSFGSSNCTRFYIDHSDKQYASTIISLFRKVWENRDICIVEGANSKLGCGNNLFNNAKSIKRIICPSTNAFQKYDRIISSIQKNARKDELLLLALGMTATVLAFDLSQIGYQALDVGHIDIEYEWFLMHATSKVPIAGKAVNECNCNNPQERIEDHRYIESIIDKVT